MFSGIKEHVGENTKIMKQRKWEVMEKTVGEWVEEGDQWIR